MGLRQTQPHTEKFQSTLPVRGGTLKPSVPALPIGFQSTLPVRGGTRVVVFVSVILVISIHPPRAGRDRIRRCCPPDPQNFNPPSPCGEGRH